MRKGSEGVPLCVQMYGSKGGGGALDGEQGRCRTNGVTAPSVQARARWPR